MRNHKAGVNPRNIANKNIVPRSKVNEPKSNPLTAKIIKMIPFSFDNYEIQKIIGVGSMAVVFLAKDIRYDQFFAAKCVYVPSGDPEDVDETKALRMLDHKNIIKIYDVFFIYESCLFNHPIFFKGNS